MQRLRGRRNLAATFSESRNVLSVCGTGCWGCKGGWIRLGHHHPKTHTLVEGGSKIRATKHFTALSKSDVVHFMVLNLHRNSANQGLISSFSRWGNRSSERLARESQQGGGVAELANFQSPWPLPLPGAAPVPMGGREGRNPFCLGRGPMKAPEKSWQVSRAHCHFELYDKWLLREAESQGELRAPGGHGSYAQCLGRSTNGLWSRSSGP